MPVTPNLRIDARAWGIIPVRTQGANFVGYIEIFVSGRLIMDILPSSITMQIRSYYCKALQGESGYNICINSDMTVSCNCRDYDGSGQIGDLHEQSFDQVFFGEKAQSFRETLLRGGLPVPVCKNCPELVLADSANPDKYLREYRVPHNGIMVENTVLCNLKCLSCRRSELLNTRKRTQMSLADVELVARILSEHHIFSVSYFNLGEPFFSPSILDEIKIIRNYNPKIHITTSTNGVLLDRQDKLEAALMMNHIYFSIDGSSQKSLKKYQVGGKFEKSFENMKALARERNRRESITTIEWKYVVFRHNDSEKEINKAIDLARLAGVDFISFWRGGGRPSLVSKRFPDHPCYESLGCANWKGREVDLRVFSYEYIKLFVEKLGLPCEVIDTIKGSKKIMADIISSELNKPDTTNEEYVKKSFRLFLGREPEESALKGYASALDNQHITKAQLCILLVDSEEFKAKARSGFHLRNQREEK
jgi:pyruvate-formate lyase-activating enzyme